MKQERLSERGEKVKICCSPSTQTVRSKITWPPREPSRFNIHDWKHICSSKTNYKTNYFQLEYYWKFIFSDGSHAWLVDYPDPSFSLIRQFLSYSRDVLCSLLFHILGNDPCQTCRRWLGWKGHVKQDSSKWTEHIMNLVPRFWLKFFLLVLTKRSHTSLVFSVGLCKATPAALLERLSQPCTTQRLPTSNWLNTCF